MTQSKTLFRFILLGPCMSVHNCVPIYLEVVEIIHSISENFDLLVVPEGKSVGLTEQWTDTAS